MEQDLLARVDAFWEKQKKIGVGARVVASNSIPNKAEIRFEFEEGDSEEVSGHSLILGVEGFVSSYDPETGKIDIIDDNGVVHENQDARNYVVQARAEIGYTDPEFERVVARFTEVFPYEV